MLSLVLLLSASLLQAQLTYQATSTQATILPPPNATGACELRASLSADMRDAVSARPDPDTGRYLLDGLQPATRYIVRLDCDGSLVEAAFLFTEPEAPKAAETAERCDVAPRQVAGDAAGGLLDLALHPECGQSLTAAASWLRFHPHSTRANVMLDPNPGAARQAAIHLGGEEVLLRQAASTDCSFPLGASWYPGTAGTYTLTVPAPAGCTWSVTATPAWVTLSGNASGTGPGQFTYIVNANGAVPRSGAITLSGGQTFVLNQLAGICLGSGDNTSWFPTAGGTYSFDLAAPAGCPWNLAVTANWIRVNSPLSGTGPATVTYTLDPNLSFGRSGSISALFSGGIVTRTIQQPAHVFNGTCIFSVSSSAFSLSPEAQSLQIGVTTQPGCSWSVLSNATWAVSASAGNGPGTAMIQVAAHAASPTRTAILSLGGLNITVNQTGVPCQAAFGSPGSFFPSSSGTYSVPVNAPQGCSWNAVSQNSGVQVLSGPTVGPGEVRFFVDTNLGPLRYALLTIGGSIYLVTQMGAPCAVIPPFQQTWMPASGGTFSLGISTGAGCPWSVSSEVPWIQISSSGLGPVAVPFTVQPNPTSQMRTGRLLLGSYQITINQVGASQ